jgi:hypothetical protein
MIGFAREKQVTNRCTVRCNMLSPQRGDGVVPIHQPEANILNVCYYLQRLLFHLLETARFRAQGDK